MAKIDFITLEAKEVCDNLEEIFGSDTEARLLELESILDMYDNGYLTSNYQALANEAEKRGWL